MWSIVDRNEPRIGRKRAGKTASLNLRLVYHSFPHMHHEKARALLKFSLEKGGSPAGGAGLPLAAVPRMYPVLHDIVIEIDKERGELFLGQRDLGVGRAGAHAGA